MCDIVEEFKKLNLSKKDKTTVRNAIVISQIKMPYPGRYYTKWNETDSATFYIKHDTEIKVYCRGDSPWRMPP